MLTGASGGIGRAIARELVNHGASVYLVGRNQERLNTLVKELNIRGNACQYIMADITKPEGRTAIKKYIVNDGNEFDVLINCAGVNQFGLFSNLSDEKLENILSVNVTAPVLLTKLLLPLLNQSGGGLVLNIGSTFGSIGYPGFVAYCASKFGLRGFTEALRRELGGINVDVAYIAPRATRTEINTDAVYDMNKELGVMMDEPDAVAMQVVNRIEKGNSKECYLGWPERLFVKLNTLIPALVDRTLARQWPTIYRYAAKDK